VLEDLGFPSSLNTIVLSEEEGVEKPAKEIFLRTIKLVNGKVPHGHRPLGPAECLHIGDELIW
jgi:FMN phosphatase YigB (HAD superfamily)